LVRIKSNVILGPYGASTEAPVNELQFRMPFPEKRILKSIQTLPINTLYLFGSAARGAQGPLSDFDFAYQTKSALSTPARFALKLRVFTHLSRALQTDHLDVVDLEEAPPLLAHRILKDGRVLYCANAKQRVRLEFSRLVEYLDFSDDLDYFVRATFEKKIPSRIRHG